MIRRRMRVATGLLCCVLAAATGISLFAQDDPMTPPADMPSAPESIADGARRLSDFEIAGLDNVVNLKSLEPWDVVQLVEFLAYKGGINNIVIGKGVSGLTTKLKFDNVTVGDALEVVLSVNRLAYEVRGGIITIMTDEEYQQLYGASFYDNKKVRVIDLEYADPTRLSTMLQPVKSTIGTVVADPVTGTLILIDTPEKIAEMLGIVRRADISTVSRVVPTETKTYELQYASVEEVVPALQDAVTPDPEISSVRDNARNNTIIVTDLPHKFEELDNIVHVFDARDRQVFIEAKIVEVNLDDRFQMGIDWNHFVQGIDPRFSLRSAVTPGFSGTASPASPAGMLTYNTIAGDGVFNAVLQALKSVGDTKILSNPHVAVVSGEEATIKVVKDQPYAEAQLESGTTNVVGETITFIEVGVILTVTPRINEDRMISMNIKPEVSTVIGNYQAFRTVPIVQKAYAETRVMVKDAETVIIAGMIRNERQETENRVPILGRIPLLGALFRSEGDQTVTSETIVFLTPRIMSGEEPMLLLRDTKKKPKPLRSVGPAPKKLKPVR